MNSRAGFPISMRQRLPRNLPSSARLLPVASVEKPKPWVAAHSLMGPSFTRIPGTVSAAWPVAASLEKTLRIRSNMASQLRAKVALLNQIRREEFIRDRGLFLAHAEWPQSSHHVGRMRHGVPRDPGEQRHRRPVQA